MSVQPRLKRRTPGQEPNVLKRMKLSDSFTNHYVISESKSSIWNHVSYVILHFSLIKLFMRLKTTKFILWIFIVASVACYSSCLSCWITYHWKSFFHLRRSSENSQISVSFFYKAWSESKSLMKNTQSQICGFTDLCRFFGRSGRKIF